MCLLHRTVVAEEGFQQLRRSGDKVNHLRKLERLASEASKTVAQGLEAFLVPVSSWRGDDQLQQLREYQMGRHRAYIKGRYTDCEFCVCILKLYKKEKVDREESIQFQRKVLKAIGAPIIEQLEGKSLIDPNARSKVSEV